MKESLVVSLKMLDQGWNTDMWLVQRLKEKGVRRGPIQEAATVGQGWRPEYWDQDGRNKSENHSRDGNTKTQYFLYCQQYIFSSEFLDAREEVAHMLERAEDPETEDQDLSSLDCLPFNNNDTLSNCEPHVSQL